MIKKKNYLLKIIPLRPITIHNSEFKNIRNGEGLTNLFTESLYGKDTNMNSPFGDYFFGEMREGHYNKSQKNNVIEYTYDGNQAYKQLISSKQYFSKYFNGFTFIYRSDIQRNNIVETTLNFYESTNL